ncbi:MAG: hypothetical protein RLZZ387_5695 [Chloroflexota bacterium]|jgi:hypothetical protein
MAATSDERMRQLVDEIRRSPDVAMSMSGQESVIIAGAVDGQSVYEIAQLVGVSEEAVWRVLGSAARAAGGRSAPQAAESGGLGSDTDPGVTGGYGDTGFGALGNETPGVIPEEPPEPRRDDAE